jgi:hypothetical protein
MRLGNHLSRLKKVSDAVDVEEVEEFFRLMHEHSGNPKVFAAIEDLSRLMKEVEAALGRPITPRQWWSNSWMESKGLLQAINRLFLEVHASVDGEEGVGQ